MTTLEAPVRTGRRHRAEAPAPAGDGPVRWVLRVLAWTVILGCGAALVLTVALPRLGGATPYTILTGSMQPAMPPGTLVVAKPVDPQDIAVGTVITYQLRSGEPTVVTHRVIAIRTNLRGDVELRTQGDANDTPDRAWVRPEQVRGERWYYVPYLGRLNTLVSGHDRQLLVYGAAAALALYAAGMFVGAGRDRLRRRSA